VLLLLFGAVLIAILLRSIAGPVARHTPIPDRGAVALAAQLILGLLAGLVLLLGTQIRVQGAALLERLPDLVQAVEDQLGADALGGWLERQEGTPGEQGPGPEGGQLHDQGDHRGREGPRGAGGRHLSRP
jgi:predicted PurR-regulated permease PerM